MSTPRFDAFFPFIVKWEGSVYENDPDDPGGATKYGIDQRSHPKVDIRNLTLEQAKEIYLESYWHKIHAEKMPPKVGEVMMDIAVNNGVGRAVKWLQQAVGVAADGALGPKTLAGAHAVDGEQLAAGLLDRRHGFYQSIAKGKLEKFLKGWLNRNHDLRGHLTLPPYRPVD